MQYLNNSINTLGFSVFSSKLDEINLNNTSAKLLNTISPNSYGISIKDELFRKALKNSDYLVLDGVYFALASIFLNGKNIKKNQGSVVFYHFMERINSSGGKVFFLGASQQTLENIKENTAKDYPNISIGILSPPYKEDFSLEDTNLMVGAINKFQPDVLFIGMTCPKQEKWGFQNKDKLNTKLICCVGAVFDWYAGNQKEIHPLWWKLRLGWLKRTIDRPEILRRYPNIGIFFWHLLLALLGNKKYKYGRF